MDEAHHLQNEWQKALEKFIAGLNKNIKIIALTATPPYDSTPIEWKRYINTCGEIDEEIFVTELVKANNLCPHQDYIYFNYPTIEENKLFLKHNESVNSCFKNLSMFEYFHTLSDIILNKLSKKFVLSEQDNFTKIFKLLKFLNISFDEKRVSKLLNIKNFIGDLKTYEDAINFLLITDIMSFRYCFQVPKELSKNKDYIKTFGIFLTLFKNFEFTYMTEKYYYKDRYKINIYNKNNFKQITQHQKGF